MTAFKFILAACVFTAFGSYADISVKADTWEGIWAFERDWCQYSDQIGEHDPAPIKITRNEFVGLENRCAVNQLSAVAGEMVLDMSCEGEGETYADRIYILENENTLKIRRDGEQATQYYRCD